MEILDLGDITALGRIGGRIGGNPLNVHLARFGIHLDSARNGVTEGVRKGDARHRVGHEDRW